MALRTLATAPASAAITDTNQVPFTIRSVWVRRNGGGVPLKIQGLAGSETLSLYQWNGSLWEEVTDDTGALVIYTATDNADFLLGTGLYGFIMDSTAGIVHVRIEDGT